MKLPELVIKNFRLRRPIFQGAMGAGFSLWPLAGATAAAGIGGTIATPGIGTIVSRRDGKPVTAYEAVRIEIEKARSIAYGGVVGVNVLCLPRFHDEIVKGAIDGRADFIFSGAGLPKRLPGIKPPGHTALGPIVSSVRALKIVTERWERMGYRPDAAVLVGRDAAGHLGFSIPQLTDPEFTLEKLLPPVLDFAAKHGNFPIIVAGGLYTHEDLVHFLQMGASAGQFGTRFLVTRECSASDRYKQAVIDAREDDIIVTSLGGITPASPCGLPFRILRSSPMFTANRPPKCDIGFVLRPDKEGKFSECLAKSNGSGKVDCFCICNGLLAAAGLNPGEPPMYTVGTNAHRVNKILTVRELVAELAGE